MDERLAERLQKWHAQIDVVSAAEKECLMLESEEKPIWSSLFLEASAKTVAEREAHAYANETWRNFQTGLVEAKSDYLKQKRLLELKQAAFNAEYLERKVQGEAIQRTPRALT